jgi:hypothetical protein
MTDERLIAHIRAEVQMLNNARSPWVDMRGLAAYSGWGFNTVKRLSSQNLIAGKVRHDGKVRFHLPTFDDWLLTEHRAGPLVALPHEEAGGGSVSRGAAAASNGLASSHRKVSSDAR